MSLSEEIKQRLDIVDIIRDYIPLKAAGSGFRALCPFHHEKSPSFMVSPDKQMWHCFGCSKGGDVFSFVMEIEGLNFVETLRTLAPRAGVEFRQEDKKLNSQRNRLLDIIEFSRKYYHWILKDNKLAEGARQYLKDRGLDDETIEEWQIGYSPDSWDDLQNFLKSKGFKENEIFLAGMNIKKEGSNRFYNRFRGRIMFPICDVNGNTVAFTARVSPEKEATEQMGKYINSPQTMVYNKSGILFGLDKAKTAIKREDLAIVVEGQMDVITAHRNGYKNVVAFSGTAITEDQIKLIKRYTTNIAFALDSDAAGQMASEKGDDLIKERAHRLEEGEDGRGRTRLYVVPGATHGLNEYIIKISGHKDPDELIKNDPSGWEEVVKNKMPLMQFFFEKEFAHADVSKIDDRRQVVQRLLPKIAKLRYNQIDQDYWLKALSQKADVPETSLREIMKQHTAENKNPGQPVKKGEEINKGQNREEFLSELLLASLLKFPELIDYAGSRLQSEHIAGESNRALYRNLIIYYNKITENSEYDNREGSNVFFSNFRYWLESTNQNAALGPVKNSGFTEKADKIALLGDRDLAEISRDQAKTELINTISVLKKKYLATRMKEIERLIADAETNKREDELRILLEEFKVISEEMRME